MWCYSYAEGLRCAISGVSVNWPVWLDLLQELHLVLDTSTGLQLFHHHLGGAKARIDLAQQNLRSIHMGETLVPNSKQVDWDFLQITSVCSYKVRLYEKTNKIRLWMV